MSKRREVAVKAVKRSKAVKSTKLKSQAIPDTRIVLDVVTARSVEGINAKNISRTVKSDLKILKKFSFSS